MIHSGSATLRKTENCRSRGKQFRQRWRRQRLCRRTVVRARSFFPKQTHRPLARVRGEMLGRAGRSGGSIPQAKWYTFEPISYDNQREGLSYAFVHGCVPSLTLLMPIHHVDWLDFLGTEHGSVAASADWARNRPSARFGQGKTRAMRRGRMPRSTST